MRTLLSRLAVVVAALGAAAGAGRALADAPCVEDAARICPGIPAKDGRLWACLQRNQFQLSTRCQKNIQEVERRASEFTVDCAADIYNFCPGTPSGAGRLVECLATHVGRRELGTNCEDAVIKALENLQEFVDACKEDAAALCQGIEPGGGRLFLCLRAQSDRLSSRCRDVVNRK